MGFIFILAQILAFVACGLNVISMQCKKKKTNIIFLNIRQCYWCNKISIVKGLCWGFNSICFWTTNFN